MKRIILITMSKNRKSSNSSTSLSFLVDVSMEDTEEIPNSSNQDKFSEKLIKTAFTFLNLQLIS